MLHTPRTKSPHQGRLRSIVLDDFSTMDLKRFSDLEAHERGTLTKIDAPEGMLALMEMGCTVGEDIEVRHIAPLGDPMAVSAGRSRRRTAPGASGSDVGKAAQLSAA